MSRIPPDLHTQLICLFVLVGFPQSSYCICIISSGRMADTQSHLVICQKISNTQAASTSVSVSIGSWLVTSFFFFLFFSLSFWGDNGLVTLTARQRFLLDQPTCNLGVHARGSCRLGLSPNHALTVGHGKRRKSKMRQGRRYFTNVLSIGMTAWLKN